MADDLQVQRAVLYPPWGYPSVGEEETNWIHRGWTLRWQEAVVPKHATVLFVWDHDMDGKSITVMNNFTPGDVVSGQSVCIGLLVSSFGHPRIEIDFVRIPVEIFGTSMPPYTALMDAVASRPSHDSESKHQCFGVLPSFEPPLVPSMWSSIFGVSLDPNPFHKDNRL